MREIAIHRATDGIRPPSAKRPRKGAGVRLPRFRHWGAVRRYGVRAVLWPAFAALMGGIVLNATAFQSGHHPAPLVATVPEPAAPRQQAALAGNAPAPVERAPAQPDPVATVPAGPATPPAARPEAQPPAAARRPAPADAKPARAATLRPHPRPGQPPAPANLAGSGPRPAERQRLAAMMAAANRGRPATRASN